MMSESEPIRILYMEDDAGLARLFQKRLRRAGYVVDVAPNGQVGLEMYRAGSYDLVATDQEMPIHNGLEVIHIIRTEGDPPPMIMVTGSGNESIAVEAMKSGASDYIVKDVDGGYLELLPAVIEKALRQHRLAEEKRRAEEEKERLIVALQKALAEVKKLGGLLPICANCKKIRDDTGYWSQVEEYISDHSEAQFTHGICPDCARKLYPELYDENGELIDEEREDE